MNAAAAILERAEVAILRGRADSATAINVAGSLATVSDADLAACAGSLLLADAIHFERARRSGTVLAWDVTFAFGDGSLKIAYSVRPKASLEYISVETTIGPAA